MNPITLNVPPGLGDAIWAYQKLAPHVGKIRLRLLGVDHDSTRQRSLSWMRLLPQVESVEAALVSQGEYDAVANSKTTIPDTLAGWKNDLPVNYCANRWLESGLRIEQIDPDYPVLERVEFPVTPSAEQGEYVVLYVSCAARNEAYRNDPAMRLWGIPQWVDLVKRVHKGRRIVLIGCSFDLPAIEPLAESLTAEGISCKSLVDRSASEIVALLAGASLFLGYQSGLNVVANHVTAKGVPQLMMYYASLRAMHYSWCRPGTARTTFFADCFSRSPEEVAQNL